MKDNVIFWPFTHFNENPWLGSTLILLFVVYIVIIILQILRKKRILTVSIVLGLLVGLYYLLITSIVESSDNTANYIDGMYIWLTMAWNIFMLLLLLVLPIYIFTMVSTAFTDSRHLKSGKKLLIVSFLSLWGMSLFGIVIAILFFPIMFTLKDFMQTSVGNLSGTGIFGGIWPEFEKLLGNILSNYGYIAISMVILSIIFAIIMNLLHKYKHDTGEGLISFIKKIREGVKFYLKGVRLLVPFVISGMLVVLFANYENTFISTVSSLGVFVILFFIGLIIIWSIEFNVVSKFRKNKDEVDSKQFRRDTIEYVEVDFSVQSAPILLPITVAYVRKLNLHQSVAEDTTTFTTFMGYSMCGGFYPALIVIFTLMQANPFVDGALIGGISNDAIKYLVVILVMIPLIMFMTLGMTGVPGVDVAIIIGVLSALGLNPAYFYTIYLIDPLLDKFRGVGNSMGFAAAAVITDRIVYGKEKQEN